MKALKRNGYKIPQDVAIVGFTESKVADLIDPPLTSVAQYQGGIAEKNIGMLCGSLRPSNKSINFQRDSTINFTRFALSEPFVAVSGYGVIYFIPENLRN